MKEYIDLVNDVLLNGVSKDDRTNTGTISVFGRQIRFKMENGFPLLTTKKMGIKSIIYELLWFLSGDTNINYLKNNNVNIWNDWANSDNDLGPIYSAVWTRWPVHNKEAIIFKRKSGPPKGKVHIPKLEKIESDFVCDLGINNKNNDGFYYSILGKVDNLEDKRNTMYKIQFNESLNCKIVSRPSIRMGTIKDEYSPYFLGVACYGKPKKNFESKIHDLWVNMIVRCYNPKNPNYDTYGGKGVYVSPRWLCFEYFLEDLSRLPFYEHWKIDSYNYNLDKDYYGSNCYDVTTCVFLKRDYNISLSNLQLRPMEIIFEDGSNKIFALRQDVIEYLGVSDETLRNYENKTYKDSLLNGLIIKDLNVDEGYIVRRKIIINQIEELIFNLKNNPFSRRHIVSGWNPELIPDDKKSFSENIDSLKQALPPCHTLFQFIVEPINLLKEAEKRNLIDNDKMTLLEIREKFEKLKIPKYKLSCQLYQRSGDLMLGVPYNIASYSLLLLMVAQCVDMVPGDFIHTFGDLHIYKNHIDVAKEQVKLKTHKLSRMLINPEKNNIFGFTIDDFQLCDYISNPSLNYQIAI